MIAEYPLPEFLEALPQRTIRISTAQAEPVAGNVVANVTQVVSLIEQAGQEGARLIQFPEKFLSGYEPDLIQADPLGCAVSCDDPRLLPISSACERYGIAAVVGAATRDDHGLHISSLVFDTRGVYRTSYHKQHLFQTERKRFQPGTRSAMLELDSWRIAMAICYDVGFPEHARAAGLAGCHIYLASALFSKGNGYHESRIWFPARALDNTIYTVLSNHVGVTGGWEACGASAVWSPYGTVVSEADAGTTGLVTVDFDPAVLAEIRKKETMLRDFRSVRSSPPDRFNFFRLD